MKVASLPHFTILNRARAQWQKAKRPLNLNNITYIIAIQSVPSSFRIFGYS